MTWRCTYCDEDANADASAACFNCGEAPGWEERPKPPEPPRSVYVCDCGSRYASSEDADRCSANGHLDARYQQAAEAIDDSYVYDPDGAAIARHELERWYAGEKAAS